MATAAAQMLVTINGKTLTVSNHKKNVVSLKVSRTIGDVANKFTMELFDESAWQLESALYGTEAAPISFQYGATGNWSNGNYTTFSGTVLTYSLTFVGAATMLSIEGIVAATGTISGTASAAYWFKNATVEWVDVNPSYPDGFDINSQASRNAVGVDGKWVTAGAGPNGAGNQGYNDPGESAGGYSTETCARMEWLETTDEFGNIKILQRVLINPANIFRRIIRKYNGEIGNGSIESGDGNGQFLLGDVDETLWINAEGINLTQTNETAASFIVNTLCKASWEPGNTHAGFTYYIDAGGKHCFKAINYKNGAGQLEVPVGYYQKESRVISFSLDTVGAMVMAGAEVDDQGNLLISTSAADLLTGDFILSDYTSFEGYYKTDEQLQESNPERETNWYLTTVSSVQVTSSSSQSLLDTQLGDKFNKISELTLSASLTIWGEYNNTYIPGNYINLTVLTPSGIPHYSSGRYFILSADDSITSEGYTIALKLFKDPGKETNEDPPQALTQAAVGDYETDLQKQRRLEAEQARAEELARNAAILEAVKDQLSPEEYEKFEEDLNFFENETAGPVNTTTDTTPSTNTSFNREVQDPVFTTPNTSEIKLKQ